MRTPWPFLSYSLNTGSHSSLFKVFRININPNALLHETLSMHSIIRSVADGSPLEKVLYNDSSLEPHWLKEKVSSETTKPQSRHPTLILFY